MGDSTEEKERVDTSTIAMEPLTDGAVLADYVADWNAHIPKRRAIVFEDYFDEDITIERKREIFRQNVSHVYIEPFSYCNRRCYFCPNVDEKRLGKNTYLDFDLICRIFEDLKTIDYAGGLSFHGFNEPLSDEAIYPILKAAATTLPQVGISLTTNGDYLNSRILDTLANSNVVYIKLSLYGPNHGHFDGHEMRKSLEKLSQRTETEIADYVLEENLVRRCLSARLVHPKIMIEVFGVDYGDTGFDRGGSVPFRLQDERKLRVRPCFAPVTEFHVDYLGNVKPCCNLTPDREEHKPYALSNLHDGRSIFEHYFGLEASKFRRDTLKVGPTPKACQKCTWPWT